MYADINEVWNNNNYPIFKEDNIRNINKYNDIFNNNDMMGNYIKGREPIDDKINEICNNYYNEYDYFTPKKQVVENFSTRYNNENINLQHKKIDNCSEFLKHILVCDNCSFLMKKKFQSIIKYDNIVDKYFTDNIKEILMVILIGIFIILILDIFMKIIKKLKK